jgi:hypothetical protein
VGAKDKALGDEKTHRRTPGVLELPLSQIQADPDFIADARLVNTYAQLNKGKIKVALTRMDSSLITTGYYLRAGD